MARIDDTVRGARVWRAAVQAVHTAPVICAGTQLDQERLRLFEPDAERRRQVLHAVAEDLRWDEPDMAGLLFALCGHHGKALEEGNTIMSTRIRALLDATTPEQERSLAADVQALALRANDLRTRCGVNVISAPVCTGVPMFQETSLVAPIFLPLLRHPPAL